MLKQPGLFASDAVLLHANKLGSFRCTYPIPLNIFRLRSFGAYLIPWTSPLSSIHFDFLDYLHPFPSPPPTLGGGLSPSLDGVHWVNLVFTIFTLLLL